ncbi:MAG TPA: hypothetical protein VFC52_02005 [Solirubrobacterales bacterium]|nr:hypothetical protein [Solirubrobacterales bacterium]
MNDFTIIGVPIDSVGRSGGTEDSPRALRELGLAGALGADDRGELDVRIRGEGRGPAAWVDAGGGASVSPARTVLLGYRDAAESVDYAVAALGDGTPFWLRAG